MLQVFCIFLFMSAASLFGALVSQVNEIVAAATNALKELDENMEAYTAIHPKYPPFLHTFVCISVSKRFIMTLIETVE
jgi:hypothetical protein